MSDASSSDGPGATPPPEGNAAGSPSPADKPPEPPGPPRRASPALLRPKTTGGHAGQPGSKRLRGLVLGALGIVYGDIGTSPLYAIRECFHGYGLHPTAPNVLGILSLIFWSLIIIISIKYLAYITRADNRGEGGILALLALVRPHPEPRFGDKGWILVVLGIFGAALLYGDGMITPAISVLSAVEGLSVATPGLTPYVLPIALAILILLFTLQSRGTAKVGALFGPIMVLWFLTLAMLGIRGILLDPRVLEALSPHHAVWFFAHNGLHGFLVMGGVFLVVTGGEALYADMGHFGILPIRTAWFCIVLPALLIHYLGQGALVLRHPESVVNPFYLLAPSWALYPLVGLATTAAVIASQATITSAFSLTRQAVQLGYLPRFVIEHTSAEEIGQIYVPHINYALLICTLLLVLGFRSSANLVAAYGVAVALTMATTTVLASFVTRHRWRWRALTTVAVTGGLLLFDVTFVSANLVKVFDGGWFPLLIGITGFTLMSTWRRGRMILAERVREIAESLKGFLERIGRKPPLRVPGTAIFMTSSSDIAPPSLVQNLKHNQVLHERVVFVTSVNLEIPSVPASERLQLEDMGHNFFRVRARYGFMEDPTIGDILHHCQLRGLDIDPEQATYFLGRETLLATSRPGMAIWREKLFSFMSNNQQRALAFFRLPPDRVIEIGWQVEL